MAKRAKPRSGEPPVVNYSPVTSRQRDTGFVVGPYESTNLVSGASTDFPPEHVVARQRTRTQPVVSRDARSAVVTWQNQRRTVTQNVADWIQAMLDAKGQPVGASAYVRKPNETLAAMKQADPALAAIIERAAGNRGYRLTTFD